MGYALEMSAGDMREVVRLLTAVERTPEQERQLDAVRERCRAVDTRLRGRGVVYDVSVVRALDELAEGAPSTTMCPSYTHAFREVVASCFADVTDFGSWRRMSWFQTVSNELSRGGVPAELLPDTFLFTGPPLRLPHPGDIRPQIGTLSIDRARTAGDAYTAALDHVHPECRDTVRRFAEAFRAEGVRQERGRTADTLFFWFD